jgi:hypothetical protein
MPELALWLFTIVDKTVSLAIGQRTKFFHFVPVNFAANWA